MDICAFRRLKAEKFMEEEQNMIRYSAIGAVGYVCGELLRMMVAHPEGKLVSVLDSFGAGEPIAEHHPALRGFYDQKILDLTEENVKATAEASDVVFIQVPSGDVPPAGWPIPFHANVHAWPSQSWTATSRPAASYVRRTALLAP